MPTWKPISELSVIWVIISYSNMLNKVDTKGEMAKGDIFANTLSRYDVYFL